MDLMLISSFFTFMGFFSPPPNPQDPNIIIFKFYFFYMIALSWNMQYFLLSAQPEVCINVMKIDSCFANM